MVFSNIPPSVSVPLFYAFVSLGVAVRLLFGTALGSLLVSVLVYKCAHYWNVEPFSAGQLLEWFSEQPSDMKVAVASAALTVAGFVIAFHTATINWQQQLRAQLKTQTAGEIEEFFSGLVDLISDAEICVQSMIDAVNALQKGKDPNEGRFAVDWALEQVPKFFSTRNQISQAQVQVHRLKGRNYTVLSSGFGLPDNFEKAISALNQIGTRMWIRIPVVDTKDPQYIQHFHNQVNVEECRAFIEAAKKYSGPISMLAGSIRGYLLSPVMGFSVPMYVGLISMRKALYAAVNEYHRVMNER